MPGSLNGMGQAREAHARWPHVLAEENRFLSHVTKPDRLNSYSLVSELRHKMVVSRPMQSNQKANRIQLIAGAVFPAASQTCSGLK
jgi:hypothetical protein